VNHDPENPDPKLRCLCWPCHRRYDAYTGNTHPGKNARRAATRKRNRAAKSVAPVVVKVQRIREPAFHKVITFQDARRISAEVQNRRRAVKPIEPFNLDLSIVRIPGT
jgi:hypothetical protein